MVCDSCTIVQTWSLLADDSQTWLPNRQLITSHKMQTHTARSLLRSNAGLWCEPNLVPGVETVCQKQPLLPQAMAKRAKPLVR
jgi:hypothetical protein